MGRTHSTRQLRLFYIIYLLKCFNSLSLNELASFNYTTQRSIYREVMELMKEDFIVFQYKRYKLTEKGEQITFLHELRNK